MDFETDQEEFWAGEFGDSYTRRNRGDELLAANLAFFARALMQAGPMRSCIELGANIGMNLEALGLLYPGMERFGVELNSLAAKELKTRIQSDNVVVSSILDFMPQRKWDLVLCKGVLIHINPDKLRSVYEKMFMAAGRYILLAEYYNPTPTVVPYRGYTEKLFKRDFAGELIDTYPQLQLVDYGFVYHRDPHFPQDDINWFLLEKK